MRRAQRVSKNSATSVSRRFKSSVQSGSCPSPPTVDFTEIDTSGLSFVTDEILLPTLYRQRIKPVTVQIHTPLLAQNYNYTWLNREIIHDPSQIAAFDPLKTIFLPNSEEVLLYHKTLPLSITTPTPGSHRSFPDIAFVVDNSGSMDWDPATASGKYDAVIIMIFSLLHWLETKHFAPLLRYQLMCFSTQTRTTGWLDYYHLEELYRVLFHYEGSGTRIAAQPFETLLKSSHKKAILMLSDGEITNHVEVKLLLEKYKSQIIFLYVQLGPATKMTAHLHDLKLPVLFIKDPRRLPALALEFFGRLYPPEG